MSINLGSAYGKVSLDASGVASGVEKAKGSFKSLESSAQRLGQTLQNVGKAMTVAVTIPMALMAKEAVMMASSYSESLNKINVVFEENAKVIEDWSKDAAKSLGMSQAAALEAAGTYGNLFTAQGMGTEQAADMSMALVQLAADLASFNNAAPEEVLLALRSGLSGEIEPLKKFGIAMNEAAMKAKAMEMGLGDNVQALTEAEKIQVRYAIILEQTAKAQGDFARTSTGLANQLRTLKANWGDTLKILGENLVPIVEKVLQQLNKWLEWFNKSDPKTQKFIATLLLIVMVAGPLLFMFGKLLPMAFASTSMSLNPLSGGIFGLIGTFVKWIGVAAMIVKILTALGIATGPVGAGILAVQAAIAGVGASIMSVLGPILLIIGGIALLYWAFKTNFMGINDIIAQLWFIIKYYFSEGWKWLVTAVKGGAQIVWDWMKRMADRIVQIMKTINWGQVGKAVVWGLANGLLLGLPSLLVVATKVAGSVLDAIKKKLGVHSPSTEAKIIGEFFGQGFSDGLTTSMSNLEKNSPYQKLINVMNKNTKIALDVSKKAIKNYYDGIGSMEKKYAENQINGVSKYFENIKKYYENIKKYSSVMTGWQPGYMQNPANLINSHHSSSNITNSQSINNTIQMHSGVTLRDVDEMMTRKIDGFTLQLNRALGGGQ